MPVVLILGGLVVLLWKPLRRPNALRNLVGALSRPIELLSFVSSIIMIGVAVFSIFFGRPGYFVLPAILVAGGVVLLRTQLDRISKQTTSK